MSPFELSSIEDIGTILRDPLAPITAKVKALFEARKHSGTPAVEALLGGLFASNSTLLRHEIAYVLGQVQHPSAIETLTRLLEDTTEDEMVRHEAAEALAAIGSPEAVETLNKFVNDASGPVRETCVLAIHSLTAKQQKPVGDNSASFDSVDPICGRSDCADEDVESLFNQLLDVSLLLWKRYEALFTLRNIASNKSAKAIARALLIDNSSALLRHEIAFVLGQLQNPCTLEELSACLSNAAEHPMARHEAALAIGAIGCVWSASSCVFLENCRSQAISTLQAHVEDVDEVVKESCLVGLDNISTERGIEALA